METRFSCRVLRLGDNIDTDIIMMTKYLAMPSLCLLYTSDAADD